MSLLLKNISLPLAPFTLEMDTELRGRMTVIFGPSGAGKTSLLDLVAGLRRAQSAFIQLDDRVLTDTSRGVSVPTRHRGIGYVPQDLALFPHLSVRQNLLYGGKFNGESSRPFTFKRVVEVLEIQPLLQRAASQNFRAARNSAWRSHGRCSPRRACFCLMNLSPASISI